MNRRDLMVFALQPSREFGQGMIEHKLTIIIVAPFFVQAIRRIPAGGSIVDFKDVSMLMNDPDPEK